MKNETGKKLIAYGWISAQAALAFLFLVILPSPAESERMEGASLAAQIAGHLHWLPFLIAAAGSAILGIGGLLALGRNLTPSPLPRAGARLIRTGIYSRVRHPIYGGVILAALAWSFWCRSPVHFAGVAAIFLFFDAKARWEEQRLIERFDEYGDYRKRTSKFIPRIY